jgi:hypothetical protein
VYSVLLLHGALGPWDEVILLALLVAFLLSLAWSILVRRKGGRKRQP